MTIFSRYIHYTTLIIGLMIFGFASFALAQSQSTGVEAQAGITVTSERAPKADQNNDSYSMDADSDGYGIPDYLDDDDDGDSIPDYLDDDDDGDTVPTTVEMESTPTRPYTEAQADVSVDGVATVGIESSSEIPSRQDDEDDEEETDDLDDVDPKAQDYNSTRSNRRKNVFGGNPNLPNEALRGREVSLTMSSEPRDPQRAVCWGRAELSNGEVYTWGEGVCGSLSEQNGEMRTHEIHLRARELRNWSQEERESFREYVRTHAEEVSGQRLLRAQAAVENDSRIESIYFDDMGVHLTYRTRMRLFGIIPFQKNVSRAALYDNGEMSRQRRSFIERISTMSDREAMAELILDLRA